MIIVCSTTVKERESDGGCGLWMEGDDINRVKREENFSSMGMILRQESRSGTRKTVFTINQVDYSLMSSCL